MRRYQITMLHPNPNANLVWVFRGQRDTIRAQAMARSVRLGLRGFTTGEIVEAKA